MIKKSDVCGRYDISKGLGEYIRMLFVKFSIIIHVTKQRHT